jgi:hypothetical protein
MTRRHRATFAAAGIVLLIGSSLRADSSKSAEATIDKAVEALGGEATLKGVKAYTWKSKGKINIGGNESEFTGQATVDGLDRLRQSFEGEFNGEKVKGLTVVDGDKGWRKFGDMAMELDKDAMAVAKRSMYLNAASSNPLVLKGKGFKFKSAPDEKVDGKDAACIEATGPDGKDFKLFFDKVTGLPIKEVARVIGFGGEELTQESLFKEFKAFDGGFKTATKVEIKHDGEKFLNFEASDFKKLDTVDPKTFSNPL